MSVGAGAIRDTVGRVLSRPLELRGSLPLPPRVTRLLEDNPTLRHIRGAVERARAPVAAGEVMPAYRSLGDPNAVGSQELMAKLRAPVRDLVADTNYDQLFMWNRLASHLDGLRSGAPRTTASEALKTFDPSSMFARDFRGTHCLGMAQKLRDDLAEQGIRAYVVGAPMEPAEKNIIHGALAVPFRNPKDASDAGMVFLDPGKGIHEPVLIREGERGHYAKPGSNWSFELDPTGSTLRGTAELKGGKQEHFAFRMDEWLNPDEATNKRYLRSNARPNLVATDRDGALTAALRLDLQEQVIKIRLGEQLPPVSTQDGAWKSAITDEVATRFGVSREALVSRLEQVIRHREDFLSLLDPA